MLTILWILGYLLIGLVTIYVTVFIHFIKAEMNGYCCMDWWRENFDLPNTLSTNQGKYQFIIGMIIWPVRLYQFIDMIPELYQAYDIRVN